MLPHQKAKFSTLLLFSFSVAFCTLVMLWGRPFFVLHPVDDIPWAKGVTMEPVVMPLRELLSGMIIPTLVISVIHLFTAGVCHAFGVSQRKWVAGLGILSSLGGLIFALSPVATELCWNVIIYFHLKRGDNNIDFLFNWLRAALSLGAGAGLCLLLNWFWFVQKKLVSR